MYVCVCKAVSDKAINRAIDGGACSVRDLKNELGAGTNCGRCIPEMRRMLAERLPTVPGPIALAELVAIAS